MIVTPCQLCQANVEIYQSEINKKQSTKFAIPVVYYSQMMSVAYGGSANQAGLEGYVSSQRNYVTLRANMRRFKFRKTQPVIV